MALQGSKRPRDPWREFRRMRERAGLFTDLPSRWRHSVAVVVVVLFALALMYGFTGPR